MKVKETLEQIIVKRRKFWFKRDGKTPSGNPKYLIYFEKNGDLRGISASTYNLRDYIESKYEDIINAEI